MEAIAVIAESKIRTAIENGEFDPTERARLSRLRCDAELRYRLILERRPR